MTRSLRHILFATLILTTTHAGARPVSDDGSEVPPTVDAPNVPHGKAINTATCDYHGTTSPFSQKYANFESSLIGVRGGTGLTIQNQVEYHQVGGASVVIIEDGAITQHHWYGCRDRKAAIRTTSLTKYQAASLSKFVTAVGMVIADRLGDVSLTDTVTSLAAAHPTSLLKEWTIARFLPTSTTNLMSLRRLLNHTAGLDTHGIDAWEPGNVPVMRDVIIGSTGFSGFFLGGLEKIHTPQTLFDYSGGGYILAEHILELEQPLAFKDYMKQHVLDEAGMTLSTFDKASVTMPNLARGCSRLSCTFDILQTNVKAAGGLLANARDYAELVTALVNGGVTDGGDSVMTQADIESILLPASHSRSTMDACSSPGATRQVLVSYTFVTETCVAGKYRELLLDGSSMYGLGVDLFTMVSSDGYPTLVNHGGSQVGTRTYFEINRDTGNGIVVMVNGVEAWVDGDGDTYGADVLINEIKSAYWATPGY